MWWNLWRITLRYLKGTSLLVVSKESFGLAHMRTSKAPLQFVDRDERHSESAPPHERVMQRQKQKLDSTLQKESGRTES